MFKNKYSMIFITGILLLSGCASKTAAEAPMPSVAVSEEVLPTLAPTSIPLPSETPMVAQVETDLFDPVTVKFVSGERVVPADMDLVSLPQEVVAQYTQVIADGSNSWAGASIKDANHFLLQIDATDPNAADLLKVFFPIHLSIKNFNAPLNDVNLLMPMSGGGGVMKSFAPLALQAGEYDFLPDDPSPLILKKDVEEIFYLFHMPCVQSGAFDLNFTIPYTLMGNQVERDYTYEYTVQLICPQSVNLWILPHEMEGEIENGGRWVFQGDRYVQQP